MYYFREGEWRDRVIHEAFCGVVSEYRGQGLADSMRAAAAEHFTIGGLNGISTHIDHDNLPSLRSAERQGFRPIPQTDGRPVLIRRLSNRQAGPR